MYHGIIKAVIALKGWIYLKKIQKNKNLFFEKLIQSTKHTSEEIIFEGYIDEESYSFKERGFKVGRVIEPKLGIVKHVFFQVGNKRLDLPPNLKSMHQFNLVAANCSLAIQRRNRSIF